MKQAYYDRKFNPNGYNAYHKSLPILSYSISENLGLFSIVA